MLEIIPNLKPFPHEKKFSSFIGVPLLNDKKDAIGVITLQTAQISEFDDKFVNDLDEISKKLIESILGAEQILQVKKEERKSRNRLDLIQEEVFETSSKLGGYIGSPGFGIGKAVILDEGISFDFVKKSKIENTSKEIEKFDNAIAQSISQIDQLIEKIDDSSKENYVAIFNTHIMILEDQSFIKKVHGEIKNKFCAEWALREVVHKYVKAFKKINDPYLRERVHDIYDIGHRILSNLLGIHSVEDHLEDDEPCIIISDNLGPSQLIALHLDNVRGFAISEGGVASHFSILAKSFNIPALVGIGEEIHLIKEGSTVLLDANKGVLNYGPNEEEINEFNKTIEEDQSFRSKLSELREQESFTKDGQKLFIKSNAGLLQDVQFAKDFGAAGIGLFRTEFQFLGRFDFPSEEEQFSLYSNVLKESGSLPATIRTLDVGGDKILPYLDAPKEKNPFLGWRSIRVSLDVPSIFKTQLRALLRASVCGNLRILYPLISGLDELRAANLYLEEVKSELREKKIPFDEDIPIGIMIELPSAVRMAKKLIKECDFFSIGTNDLTQYTLAVDRDNKKVARLYSAFHPAVLDQINDVAKVALEAGKTVSVCGEVAGEILFTVPLIGFGINDLSLTPSGVPFIKFLLRHINISEAREVAKNVLELETPDEVRMYLIDYISSLGLIPDYLIH